MKRRWLVLLAVALAPSSAASGAIARSTADQPDDSGLPQIHLMYVVPSDGVDRGFDVNGTIVDSTASWEGWLAGQTGGRLLRLDTYLGQPDVTFARLPQSDSQIASNGPYVRDEVQRELHALGFDAPNKVYAVFYDGSSTFSCGGGAWPPALPGNVAALYLRGVSSGIPCPDVYAGPGQPPGYRDFSMIHEIMHTLGFVPTCAPHHTLSGHVSDDPSDLMYAGSAPWQPSILDVNHDDYYGANVPGCLDFAQSPYLTSSHGVSVVVNGPGNVTSTPAGIACPGSCSATFDGPVALSATPAAGAAFDGWSGACTGTGACTVTGDATVTASFSALATLTVTVEGKGSVAGGGIACPPTCTAALRAGTSVTLEATPAAGYAFAGWAGPCSGKGSCTLTLTGDTGVTAAFVTRPHRRALTFAVRARLGRGLLRASDGYQPCAGRVPVLVESRTGRGWSAVRRVRTNHVGKFAVVLTKGVARARAPQVVVGGQTCLAAVSRSVRAR